MREIIFGTKNQAKIEQVQSVLPPEIKLIGLSGFKNLPKIIENGKNAQENARIKALTLSKVIGKPVFAMDNALYFKNVDDSEQPGINVRRIPGGAEYPTDQEMMEYYTSLIVNNGGKIQGYWEFALVYAMPDGQVIERTIKSPIYFVSKPSKVVTVGYPLDSLSIDPETKKYISEMTKTERANYWQKTIGKEIKKFFTEI